MTISRDTDSRTAAAASSLVRVARLLVFLFAATLALPAAAEAEGFVRSALAGIVVETGDHAQACVLASSEPEQPQPTGVDDGFVGDTADAVPIRTWFLPGNSPAGAQLSARDVPLASRVAPTRSARGPPVAG